MTQVSFRQNIENQLLIVMLGIGIYGFVFHRGMWKDYWRKSITTACQKQLLDFPAILKASLAFLTSVIEGRSTLFPVIQIMWMVQTNCPDSIPVDNGVPISPISSSRTRSRI